MILLEVGGLESLILFFLIIMFGPPIIFMIIGIAIHGKNPKRAKTYFILGGVYLLIAGGICATM